MGYLNTFLYLNHEPDFHNIVEYESPRSEPVFPYLNATTELQTDNENNIKKNVQGKNNLTALENSLVRHSPASSVHNHNDGFSFKIEELPADTVHKPNFITESAENTVVYFVDNLPNWISDLKKVFPMLDFKVKTASEIEVPDIVILFDDSLVISEHVIRAKGKKTLWQNLCKLVLNQ